VAEPKDIRSLGKDGLDLVDMGGIVASTAFDVLPQA
jgi:hypothetical protein